MGRFFFDISFILQYNKKMLEKWTMIDIETLGTGDMPVILSIGIILFNPWDDYRSTDLNDLNTLYLRKSLLFRDI